MGVSMFNAYQPNKDINICDEHKLSSGTLHAFLMSP